MRNTVEASGAGQATRGGFGNDPGSPAKPGCTDEKASMLAEMVLDHREGLGLSQREFARESGVSRTILSKIEKGEMYPGGKVRRKLAAAMDLSPIDLWRIGPNAAGDQRNGFSRSERKEHKEAS